MPFLFEKLDSYQKAVLFAEQVSSLLEDRSISYVFRDQLSRASLSVSLNLAEGNGRWHAADKRQFFYVARGSIFECVPLLQLMKRKGILDEGTYANLYGQAEELSKMISGLIRAVDREK